MPTITAACNASETVSASSRMRKGRRRCMSVELQREQRLLELDAARILEDHAHREVRARLREPDVRTPLGRVLVHPRIVQRFELPCRRGDLFLADEAVGVLLDLA